MQHMFQRQMQTEYLLLFFQEQICEALETGYCTLLLFPFQNPHQALSSCLPTLSVVWISLSAKVVIRDKRQIRYLRTIQNSSVPSELSLSVAQTQVMDRRSQDPFQDHLQTEDFFPHVIEQFAVTFLEVDA